VSCVAPFFTADSCILIKFAIQFRQSIGIGSVQVELE